MKCKHPSKCFILISWVLNPLYSPTVWWQVQAWGPCRTLSFLGLKEAVLCHLFPVEKERSGWISHLDLSPLGDAHEVWDHYDDYWLLIIDIVEAAWPSGQRVGLAIRRSWVRVPLWPVAGFVLCRPEFKFSATLVNSQLVALCQLEFLILLCCIYVVFCIWVTAHLPLP